MFKVHGLLIAYAVAIPLALVLGYLVATPDTASIAAVGMVFFVLVLPFLMQYGHWVLILLWNSALVAGFLPGSMPLWFLFAGITFGFGLIHFVMGHRSFLRAPELTKPILFLTAVVLVTAKIRGGIGLRSMGGENVGGKNYFFVLGAVLGYFALTAQPISLAKSAKAANCYFLSFLTWGLSNLVYGLGPAFYILYYVIATDFAYTQASADIYGAVVKRFGSFGPCAIGLLCFMLARWGARGIFEWQKPWRLILLLASFGAALASGFRSQIAFVCVLFAVKFMIEGLWRTALLPVLGLLGLLVLTPMLLLSEKMPAAVQRSMAFLPVNIDPDIRAETVGSTEWRFDMWRMVWQDVPKYLLVGKGYTIDPLELEMVSEGYVQDPTEKAYYGSAMSGDYHSGPLSVLMPFGFFGACGVLWLMIAGVKVLRNNWRYGDSRLVLINGMLLAYFLTQTFFFIFVFGAFNSQLSVFLGVLGLSVSLNGGVCRKPALARQTSFAESSVAVPAAA